MKKKRVLWFLLIPIILLFLLIAIIPSWVSTPSGTRTLVKWINSKIDGKVTINTLNLSWLGYQRLENIALYDVNGTLIFSLKTFETTTSLLYLALGGRTFNQTLVESPFLTLQKKQTTEIEEEIVQKPEKKEKGRRWAIPNFESLQLRNGEVQFSQKESSLLALREITVEKTGRKEPFHLRAKTQHANSEGTVSIDASQEPNLNAQIHLIDFPVAILDELKTPPNFYTTALGPTLNSDLDLNYESSNGFLFLRGSAKSSHLQGFIAGHSEGKNFLLNPETHLKFTLTPAFFKLLVDEKQRGNWDLASKTEVQIDVEKGTFPLTLKNFDYKQIAMKATARINRAEIHHSELGSYTLKQFDAVLSSLENIEIRYQGEILGKEDTHLAGTISLTPKGKIIYNSTFKNFPITLTGLFSSKLESNLRLFFGNQIDLVSHGSVVNRQINAEIALTSPATEAIGILKGDASLLNFEARGTRFIKGEKEKILGSSIEFILEGALDFEEERIHIPSFSGKLFNPYVDLNVKGYVQNVDQMIQNTHMVACGTLMHLPLEDEQKELTLGDIALFFQLDGSKGQVKGNASGDGLFIDFNISDFVHENAIQFEKSKIDFKSNLKNFPVALINPFVSETIQLSEWIGPKLTLFSKGTYAPERDPRLILELEAEGSGFSTFLAISVDGTLTVNQDKPSYVYWEITPQRYRKLIQQFRLDPGSEPTFMLTRPTEIRCNISQLTCPTDWPKTLGSLLCQGGFVGEIEMGVSTFQSSYHSGETIVFRNVKGSIQGVDFSEAINLNLKGDIFASQVPTSEQSAFSFDGKMLNFWTKTGKFNREGLTLKGELNLDLLPVRPFLGIIPIDQETRIMAQAILGDLVNSRIQGEISQMAGPITVDVKSSNFKALLPLQLQPNAILLRDFVDAEITLTPEVNEVFLKDISPLLLTGAYSEHPIKVYIDPQGFMIPLHPYHFQGIQIGRAVVSLGKIRVRNGGQIQSLTNFLKAKEVSPDGMMQAWFTPIYLSYQNGVAHYQRFDVLLATNIHIAMWGSINLISGQVNMTLGISTATLHQRFKFKGLRNRDMFQVKMRGTTDHLELDWGSASSRLGFILARAATSGLGSIIGGLLESLSSALGEQPTPAPTTNPLPWEHP